MRVLYAFTCHSCAAPAGEVSLSPSLLLPYQGHLSVQSPKGDSKAPRRTGSSRAKHKTPSKIENFFHDIPHLFLNHRERQMKNVFVSAELIVVAA